MGVLKILYEETLKLKFLLKPFFILSIIYCVAITAIIRANFNYIDDLGRVYNSYRGWSNWSRYVSEYLSVFVHTESRLMDISPLPQIIAALILALASAFLIYIFNNNKKDFSRWSLFAVIPLGLSPYFLECLSYKFDSLYMALSILASIFPFLFVNHCNKIFFTASFISSLVMCMTYQASSGIYVVIALFLVAQNYNKGFDCLNLLKVSALAYISSLILFRFAFMRKLNDYVTTDTAGAADLVPTVINNIKTYFNLIVTDFNRVWLVLIVLIAIIFLYVFVKSSVRNKFQAFGIAICLLLFGSILSYGGYILLKKPLFAPRGMYGIGAFLAILNVYIVANTHITFNKIVCVLLSWCFFVFSFTYGNALAEQKRYTDFRINLLINDLNDIKPQQGLLEMQLDGNIGKAPTITKRLEQRYPIVKRLVPSTLGGGGWVWNEYYLYNYFALPGIKQHIDTKKEDFKNFNLPVFVNSRYHDIKTEGKHILVTFKQESL